LLPQRFKSSNIQHISNVQKEANVEYIGNEKPPEINLKASSGGKGIELEPYHHLLPENEDFLLLIKDLLDAVEAMEISEKEN